MGPIKKPSQTPTLNESNSDSINIVGVGASAGGLEAFKQLLESLPIDTGLAYVLVQHLDPNHESLSPDILSRSTKMPVIEASDNMKIESNHVYMIPPGFCMSVSNGELKLYPRVKSQSHQRVIDFFLRALAEDQKENAIGIVLSGTGNDGSEGLTAIKAAGGITFAQSLKSAKFDEMPKNAIATMAVDLILTPQEIAAELANIAIKLPQEVIKAFDLDENEAVAGEHLNKILLLLRNVCHVDFTYYKSNTILRRLARRMTLHRMESIEDYANYLAKTAEEVKALYADILIHVTQFFRDPEAYESLIHDIFPKLIENRAPGLPIRIWVPACSTGEEVYSLAMAFSEFLCDTAPNITFQIFASDVSEQAIQKARAGEYSENIMSVVSAERMKRFFTKSDAGHYKVNKSIRDVCLFSRHDLTVDPPFAKIDLISCRNLLIYLTNVLQKHVMPLFHYSLVPKGYLWLGKSETVGGFTNLFSIIDKTNKTYARKDAPTTMSLQFPASTYVPGNQHFSRKAPSFVKPILDIPKIADLALQSEYPGVLINEEMEILQFRGRTAPFIEPVAGLPSYHLLKMARSEFQADLLILIQSAKKQNITARKEGLAFKDGSRQITFNLKVIPTSQTKGAPPATSNELFFLILFENTTETVAKVIETPVHETSNAAMTNPLVLELQHELLSLQDYQRSLTEKHEMIQEDYSMVNEELQSTNEELQSTNEELETAKEELQSSNEELTTVNDELQSRSLEQLQLSNDLINLLGSVEIPILMLGHDSRIRRFTPLAARALNLIASDVGRPISDLKLYFSSPEMKLDLSDIVSEVLDSLNSKEIEVQDKVGHWFRMQIRPYKTVDNRIDGAVIALVDIDDLKQSLKDVKAARIEAENANRAKDLFLATLSHELRTPLTAILSWAQMIRKGRLDEAKTKMALKVIEDSGHAQAQLINDLLDVSRIIAGKLDLQLSEVNPDIIIKAAVDAVKLTAELKAIKIETHFGPKVGTIMADSIRLQQVVCNLLTNAIKFSKANSKIIVGLETISDQTGIKAHIQIQVSDFGKGINPEFLPHIFNRFSQEDNSSVRIHGGLGLGLAIVKNLVELHGGKIQAKNHDNATGAIFSISLPIKSVHPLPMQWIAATEGVTKEINLSNVRVLILDDEPNTREAFTEILKSYGAITQSVECVKDGLISLPEFKPDVIVSDIAMPLEDGYSFIKKVRLLPADQGGKTPAIAVTAFAGAEDIQRAFAAGFQIHLSKPFNGSHLAETIERLLSIK